MKVIIDEAIPFIKGRTGKDTEVVYRPGNLFTPELVKDADALVVRTRTRCDENLLKDSKVKLVATATIGTDHIDTSRCESRGIKVRNAPGCNAPGVAQYLFASIFRKGFDPERDTLGIVGYGNVGGLVGKWAREMGIKTLVSDPLRAEQGLEDEEYLPLEEVLSRSDTITLHVPLTKKPLPYPTFHLIGRREIEMMKPEALLVNSSRGGVVEESALKEALQRGRIRAVVDVWENEPAIDPSLASLVEIATPHIAGYSAEGKRRATRMALEALHEELGIPVDLSGLECIPPEGRKISPDLILNSYDPEEDSRKLLNNLSDFESLRNNYNYRHEPLFS